jgi:hypothetical protein
MGGNAGQEPCPECGCLLVLCEVESQNAVVRVWGERRESLWGVNHGRYTTVAGGTLGPSTDGQPLGELSPVMNSHWQTARACPGCGLLWLQVAEPHEIRPVQSNEIVPSDSPAGRGSEIAADEAWLGWGGGGGGRRRGRAPAPPPPQ